MKVIDKDKVVAEIEKRKSKLQSRIAELGIFESTTLDLFYDVDLYDDILSFLDTLEVKETNPSDDGIQNLANDTLYRVKETDNERIMNALVEHFSIYYSGSAISDNVVVEDVLAWLEKQREKKTNGKTLLELWEDMRLEIYAQASGNRHEPNCSDDCTKMFSLSDIDEIILNIIEKQKMEEQQ